MRIHLLAAVAAAGLMAGTAWAGGDKSAASQSSPAAAQSSSAAAERSGSSSSGAMMNQAELQQQIGKDIQTRSGETVGRLDDIVLDAGGKPQKAIIALSDSSKNVAVPFADLQQDGAGWSLQNQSKQQLAAMSSYQHDPNTVSLNHPRGSSGSSGSALPGAGSPSSAGSSANPSSRSPDSTAPSSALPSGSSASPSSPSSRTQP